MFGTDTTHVGDTDSSAYIRSKFREYNRQRGVVIRACEEVFDCMALRRKAAAKQGARAQHQCFCVRSCPFALFVSTGRKS
jgi:hypothetical protein